MLFGNFPLLSVSRTPSGSVSVSWPGAGNGATQLLTTNLQSSPNLTAPIWTPVTNGIAQVGVEYVYIVPALTEAQSFRLVLP